ncbi:hypothetical protein ACN28C_00875 [Plantactinospora sp. WMMC1484]|uniref:hypothetical protein n=1 Tax=Plantactinospora sp. WMMC1484 TaxID=3404122 RepID=UPI003BF47501
MRRLFGAVVAGVLIALTLGAPARAARPGGSGWVHVPSPPFDYPAGLTCDFGVHGEPIVDKVYYRTLTTTPDGTARTEAAVGPLVYRLTNVSTGATVEGDASSSSLITHHDDGALTYRLHGPLLLGIREGRSNLPGGLYVVDGVAWRLDISADNFRTISGAYRIAQDVCADLS